MSAGSTATQVVSADTTVSTVPSAGTVEIAAVVRSAAVQSVLALQSSSYGGSYIDTSDGQPAWVVGYTADASVHEQELQRALPQGFPLHVRTVPYTWASLESLSRQVAGEETLLAGEGIQVVSVGPSPQRDRVVVGALAGETGAAAAIAQRYGPSVVVETTRPAIPVASSGGGRGLWIVVAVLILLVAAGTAFVMRRARVRGQPAL